MKNKILKSCMALMLMVSSISTVKAYSYQSKPGVEIKYESCSNAAYNVRHMESAEGTMGLNAEFDKTTWPYEKETTPSNNIDVHLAKNTEFAAIVMLAKSNYGIGGKSISKSYNSTTYTYPVEASTTHNMTGVFGLNYNRELVAAGIEPSALKNYKNRYLNRYVESSSTKFDESNYIIGDGLYELRLLHDGYFLNQDYPSKGYYIVRNELFETSKAKRKS